MDDVRGMERQSYSLCSGRASGNVSAKIMKKPVKVERDKFRTRATCVTQRGTFYILVYPRPDSPIFCLPSMDRY